MKAIVVQEITKDMSGVAIGDVAKPSPGPGELLVRVEAAALNPVDWKLSGGAFPNWTVPHIIGLDAAGVVEAAGPSVTGWTAGDRVVWHGNLWQPGVFAEFAVAPAHVVSRIPAEVDAMAAAAVPCAGYTAYQGLVRKARLERGQVVVVQGASGGVGGFGVQIAAGEGATVIALARPEQEARVRALGAHHVVDYRMPDLRDRVRALTPDGYGADIMLEVVNPGDARKSLELLHYNGQLVTVDPLPNLSQTPAYTYACSLHEVALGGAYGAGHLPTQRDFARIGDYFMERLARKTMSPMIEHAIDFLQIPDYLRRLRDGDITGKIVARVDG